MVLKIPLGGGGGVQIVIDVFCTFPVVYINCVYMGVYSSRGLKKIHPLFFENLPQILLMGKGI